MVNKKIQLQNDGVNLFPLAILNGIDVNNIISSINSTDYTATEDCYVYILSRAGSGGMEVKIDGKIVGFYLLSVNSTGTIYPLKKGQRITWTAGGYELKGVVYGIKR